MKIKRCLWCGTRASLILRYHPGALDTFQYILSAPQRFKGRTEATQLFKSAKNTPNSKIRPSIESLIKKNGKCPTNFECVWASLTGLCGRTWGRGCLGGTGCGPGWGRGGGGREDGLTQVEGSWEGGLGVGQGWGNPPERVQGDHDRNWTEIELIEV